MRAIEFRQFGDPSEQLHVVERPDPHATASTTVVRVAAASINPSDVGNVAGRMSQTRLPPHGLAMPDSQVPLPSQAPGVKVLPLQESQFAPA